MEALDPLLFGAEQTCFGCGPHNDRGWRLRFFREDERVVTEWTPQAGHDGPPGILHGGLQATLLDEVAGWALATFAGCMGLTSQMTVRYLLPVRLGVPLRASAWITEDDGRHVQVRARLEQEGRTKATARLSFVIPDEATARQILGDRMSDHVRRFLR